MRLYKSHKVVAAAVIVSVIADEECKKLPQYVLDDGDTVEHPSGANYLPKVGDYYVVYEDSYASLSPKAAFENGYTLYLEAAHGAVSGWNAQREVLEAVVTSGVAALRDHMGCAGFTLQVRGGIVGYKHALTNDDDTPACLSFSSALFALKNGARIARDGWNGKGLSVLLHDTGCCTGIKNFFIVYPNGEWFPWHPSPTDVLAEDWCILADAKASDEPELPLYEKP